MDTRPIERMPWQPGRLVDEYTPTTFNPVADDPFIASALNTGLLDDAAFASLQLTALRVAVIIGQALRPE